MADNKIKDEIIKAVTDKVNRSLKKGITESYVDELKDRIVTRTRVGIGIDPATGRGERLKKLAPITKKVRQGKARIFSTKNGGKIVWTDGSDEEGISRKQKKTRQESFKAFFGSPTLSNKTTPSKSNLTATGQLLNSLTVIKLKIKNGWGFKIAVGDRRGRDMWGQKSKIGNKKLVEYLKDQGRNFLGFTKSQRNIIVKEIRNIIIKGLK